MKFYFILFIFLFFKLGSVHPLTVSAHASGRLLRMINFRGGGGGGGGGGGFVYIIIIFESFLSFDLSE